MSTTFTNTGNFTGNLTGTGTNSANTNTGMATGTGTGSWANSTHSVIWMSRSGKSPAMPNTNQPHAAQYASLTVAALLTIADQIEAGLRPALVIGVPVGFVNVVESKERLFATCEAFGVPAIVAMGRKGGSNVAAAICNALLYSAAEMLDPAARGWR